MWVDVILGLLLLAGTWDGMRKGLLRMLLGLAAWAVTIYLAGNLGFIILDAFIQSGFNPLGSKMLSIVLVLIGAYLVFKIARFFLNQLENMPVFGWLNRLAGAVAGFLKCYAILLVPVVIITFFNFGDKVWPSLEGSRIVTHLRHSAEIVRGEWNQIPPSVPVQPAVPTVPTLPVIK